MASRVECDLCGTYTIAHELQELWKRVRDRNGGNLLPEEQELLPYLSSAIRTAVTPITLDSENWQEVARPQRSVQLNHKLRRLLELVQAQSAAPGDWVLLDPEMTCPLLAARDISEFEYLREHLSKSGLLRTDRRGIPGTQNAAGGFTQMGWFFQLTVDGWEAVAPLLGGVAGTCFVAMSFDRALDDAYDNGILPAVEHDCGFKVLRIDRTHHNDPITDRIVAGIRSSQFVVADFTLQRPGVYYEAGFALGIGRSVIWTCRDDDKGNLHFDTRQFNHVLWTTPANLRLQLADRIRATIPGAKTRP